MVLLMICHNFLERNGSDEFEPCKLHSVISWIVVNLTSWIVLLCCCDLDSSLLGC